MTSPVLLPPRTLLPLFPNASARNLFLFVLFIFVFWVVFMASKDHTEVRMVSYYIISQGGSERIFAPARQRKRDLCSLFPCTVCVHRWGCFVSGRRICASFYCLALPSASRLSLPMHIEAVIQRSLFQYFPLVTEVLLFFSVHLVLLQFPLSAVYFIWFPCLLSLVIFMCLLFSTQTRRVCCKWLLTRLHPFAFLLPCLTSFLLCFLLAALP